jgi:glycosyltransferase involved in cell wall biosynthesis
MPIEERTPTSQGVSVVIPTKNRAELLRQTLRSIDEQSMAPAEVIVADDGSTDETELVVREFGARHLHNPCGDWGPSAARNAGMDAAHTPYVAFIDSDDLYHPLALERLHGALAEHQSSPFAFGRGLSARPTPLGWQSDGVIGPRQWELSDLLCSLYARNSVPSGGAMVRRELALDLGGFDEQFVFAEDHAFWLKLARNGEPVHVPEIVGIHRRHTGNRMTPSVSARYDRLITETAISDKRLEGCVSRRLGVLACEMASDALHQRSPRNALEAAKLLVNGSQRLAIARAAITHWRMRRAGAREGALLLENDTELGAWLATY